MEYRRFCKLIEEGEKQGVDFKLTCHAFSGKQPSSNAELAKDICAMANNGNATSYIIIGVSDDGRYFASVENPGLTDDHLQDFCKKAISPPPEIALSRQKWRRASAQHAGKIFVIITIGPNPKQPFRLAQDFIDYGLKICYRRNDVWIRRGATSDLATPDEIIKLWGSERLRRLAIDAETAANRERFSLLSEDERKLHIRAATVFELIDHGYTVLGEGEALGIYLQGGSRFVYPVLWKKARKVGVIITIMPCVTGIRKKDIQGPVMSMQLPRYLAEWSILPDPVKSFTRRRITAVRRILFIPVLGAIPISRISEALPRFRRLEGTHHFYAPFLRPRPRLQSSRDLVASSTEILFMGNIRSVPEYENSLERWIIGMEATEIPIIKR